MLSDLEILKVYGAMARHAAESQRVSSINVTHAAKPGYKAIEVEPFDVFLKRAQIEGSLDQAFKHRNAQLPVSPNGNSVNIEQEVLKSAEASGQHHMAMTVYSKTIDLVRAAMGRRN